jgi:hypothetical protein
MVYRFPRTDKGAIEVHPVSGKKTKTIARSAGLAPSSITVLLAEGDNRPGLGYTLAKKEEEELKNSIQTARASSIPPQENVGI